MTRFSDIRGKSVVDWEGNVIGKINDIEFNLINNQLTSIIVHQGFFKHDTKIIMEYIDKIESDKVFLKITPVTKLIGKKVYDSCSKEVGKVTDVLRVGDTNVLKDIVVKMTITIPRGKGYTTDGVQPTPGKPTAEFRANVENTLTGPASDIDRFAGSQDTETFKEELTIPAKYIDSFGEYVMLNLSKEELIQELF